MNLFPSPSPVLWRLAVAAVPLLLVACGVTRPPAAVVSRTARRARSSIGTVCCRSMMWTWLRTPKRYGAMRGFHRRVWWPKWTPASSS